MATAALDCQKCPVRHRAACSALDPGDRANLAKAGRTLRLKRGEVLFAAGDEIGTCATLVSGALKVSNCDRNGVEHILALIHPAGFVGEMFTPFAHHDVIAISDCELCVFTTTQFETTLHQHPRLAEALLRRSQADLHEARTLVELIGRRSASGKVAGLLLALGRAASHSPCHAAPIFDLPLTRGEMAAMLGVTIETVSRQLTKFDNEGLIERTGSRGIVLRDPEGLEAAVDAED